MPADPCQELPAPGLLQGIKEFNQGAFLECHETLEALWLAEARPVRRLYQGFLQIGVAFYHLRAGRYHPTVTLLEGGSRYLRPFAPACLGVDVTRLLAGAERCLVQVRRLGPEGLNDFDWTLVPTIEKREDV